VPTLQEKNRDKGEFMRIIIAGSRGITDYSVVHEAIIQSGWLADITHIVSGCALGVDKLGERFADNYDITVIKSPADWKKHKKAAGYIRNQEMAQNADALIAVWDGKSKGTMNMIEIMQAMDLPVFIWRVKK
jgi:hypothetical protein